MAYTWTSALSVGISDIDDQHKDLIKQMNDLVPAMRSGMAAEKIGEMLDFLKKYVNTHFGYETKLMKTYNYPHAASHLTQHEKFKSTFESITQSFIEKGTSNMLAIRVQNELLDWFINHISNVDKALGTYITSQKAA